MGILESARNILSILTFEPVSIPAVRTNDAWEKRREMWRVGRMMGSVFFSYKPVKYNVRCSHCNEVIPAWGDRWAATVVTMKQGSSLTETTVRCKKCMDFLSGVSSAEKVIEGKFEEIREKIREEGKVDKDKNAHTYAGVRKSDDPRVYVPKAGEWNPTKPVA